jgi:protoheme IX farnesyltransferase
MAPWGLGYAGPAFGVTALLAGVGMVALAWRVLVRRHGAEAERAAGQMFAFSIAYLFLLFAVRLVESGLGGLIGRVGHWVIWGIG